MLFMMMIIMIIVIILNVLIMSLYESQLACMSISESQSVSENVEDKKVLLHDRNRRYCREDSQKLHTNEKLHARERLRSESHFRLVFFFFEKKIVEEKKLLPPARDMYTCKSCKYFDSVISTI